MKTMKAELMAMKASKEEVEEEMNKLRCHYEERINVIDSSSLQRTLTHFRCSITRILRFFFTFLKRPF